MTPTPNPRPVPGGAVHKEKLDEVFQGAPGPLPKSVKPNVVLVLLDDVPTFFYDMFDEKHPFRDDGVVPDNTAVDPVNGTDIYVQAPVLSRMAKVGLTFLNAYAQPFCGPDRAALMSGRWAHNTGLGGPVTGAFEFNTGPGYADSKPLPVALRELGYETGLSGKWHLASRTEDGGTGWAHIPKEGGWDWYRATFSNFGIEYMPVGGPILDDIQPIGDGVNSWVEISAGVFQRTKTSSSGTPAYRYTRAVLVDSVESTQPVASVGAVTQLGDWHVSEDRLTLFHDGKAQLQRRSRLDGGHYNYLRNDNGSIETLQSGHTNGTGVRAEEVGDEKGPYSGQVAYNDAEAFVAQAQEPFFLTIATNLPHIPKEDLYPQPDSKVLTDRFRTGGQATGTPRSYHTLFAAAMEFHDTRMGEFFASMPADVLARTVVIFTSDNGAPNGVLSSLQSGATGIDPVDIGSTLSTLVGLGDRMKNTPYQGAGRVPLVIAGPGIASSVRGTRTEALCHTVDLYATCVELAGGTPAPNVNGVSQVPLLLGTRAQVRNRVLMHRFRIDGMPGDHTAITGDRTSTNFDDIGFTAEIRNQGALNGRYSLVRHYAGGGTYTEELYWLENLDGTNVDRWELNDLHGQSRYAAVQAAMVAALDAELAS